MGAAVGIPGKGPEDPAMSKCAYLIGLSVPKP